MVSEKPVSLDVPVQPAGIENSTAWKAGASQADITPREPLWLVAGPRDRPYAETLNPLWIRALALEDPFGTRGVILSVEILHVTAAISNAVAADLHRSHGLLRSAVMVHVTDTHNSPMVAGSLHGLFDLNAADWSALVRYRQELEKTMIRVAREALESMEPAWLSWGNGKASFGVNRRNNIEKEVPALRAVGQLKGPDDHDVPVLRVTDVKGRLRAAVFGYACQNSSLSSAPAFHGDYAGFAQAELEKRHPGMTALFFMGCGSDVNALPRGTLELSKGYGIQLADAVDSVIFGNTMHPAEGRLGTAYAVIELPFQNIPSREELQASETRKRDDGYEAYARRTARHLLWRLDTDGRLSPTYPYPIQVWRLGGELLWIALAGEVVVDYSIQLKKELGISSTWVAGYANDVMGYIPSERVLAEGGYEGGLAMMVYGQPSPWSPGIQNAIVEKARELAAHLR